MFKKKEMVDEDLEQYNKNVEGFGTEIDAFYTFMCEYHNMIVKDNKLRKISGINLQNKKEVLKMIQTQEQVLKDIQGQYTKDKKESDAKNKVVQNYKGCNIVIRKADLTQEREDAIVNPANEDLNHKGGAAKQIALKGGEVIQKESEEYIKKYGELPTGEATTTNSGDLPCEKVIHVVGPIYPQNSMRDQKE